EVCDFRTIDDESVLCAARAVHLEAAAQGFFPGCAGKLQHTIDFSSARNRVDDVGRDVGLNSVRRRVDGCHISCCYHYVCRNLAGIQRDVGSGCAAECDSDVLASFRSEVGSAGSNRILTCRNLQDAIEAFTVSSDGAAERISFHQHSGAGNTRTLGVYHGAFNYTRGFLAAGNAGEAKTSNQEYGNSYELHFGNLLLT